MIRFRDTTRFRPRKVNPGSHGTARIYVFATRAEAARGPEGILLNQAGDPVEPAVERALYERLEAFPAFARLPPRSLGALVDTGSSRLVRRGQAVLQQGEPSASLFIVLSGRFKMIRSLSSGRSILLSLFNPGDLVGVAAGLGGKDSDATVEALESSLCLEIQREKLLAAMARRPQLIGELLPAFTERVAECNNCAVEGVFFRVEPRFARLFLRLADSVGQPQGSGTFIPVPLSRQDLADMAGTTIETSIRILSRWGKEHVVETRDDGFLLSDRDALAALCGD